MMSNFMSFLRTRSIDAVLVGMLVIYALAALLVPKGYALGAFGNLAQAFLQALAVFALLLNVTRSTQKHQRAFWYSLAAGGALWLAGQWVWIWFEVILHQDVPNPSSADILFFLHTVPLIAAATLQPHAEFREGDQHLPLGYFDFAMLLVWWIFVYGYAVAPWQYAAPNQGDFGTRYNVLYLIENLFVVVAFGVLGLRTKKSWRYVYRMLFVTYAVYTASSYMLNVAIDFDLYYSGGVFDIPLVAALILQACTGFYAYRTQLEPEPPLVTVEAQNFWHARLAGVAVLSMPLFGFWVAFDTSIPVSIQQFRLYLTLGCMLALMLLLFFKQGLVDRKLLALVRETRQSYDDLQRLQSHLVQTEKLASIGRLVAGAAHEINNPLTAILGYSDLLVEEKTMAPEHQEMAEKIRQQARRTKQLVQNFLTFAKQAPIHMAPLNLNAVVANALQLQELDLGHRNIETVCRLPDAPVIVNGDENHLLQMCVHIFNNATEAMADAHGKGTLTVSLEVSNGQAVIKCQDTGPGVAEPSRIFDPFYTTKAVGKGTGLGLSACYGIVRDHGGLIGCTNLAEGGAQFQVSLPLAAEESKTSVAFAQAGPR